MPVPRKSQRLKEIAGTARPDRRPKSDMAERLSDPPDPPPHLTDRAAAQWRELAPAACGLGTLTRADLVAFALLAETLATAEEAQAILAAEGLAVATADGGRKPHPAVRIMETARGAARGLLADFGLNPRARQGIDLPPKTDRSPWDEFGRENAWDRLNRLQGTRR